MHHDQSIATQANADQVIQDFRYNLEKIRRPGVRSAPAVVSSRCPFRFSDTSFIPEPALEEYLTIDQITTLLRSIFGKHMTLPVDVDWVHQKFCKIFAILLLIGEGGYIKHFVENSLWDGKLPFDVRPPKFPYFPPHTSDDFWARFHDAQWQFCAHSFSRSLVNNRLDENVILPIVNWQILVNDSDSGTIIKITLCPDYHTLREGESDSGCLDPNVFVIKSFDGHDSRRLNYYHSEVDALKTLKCNDTYHAPAEIVGFYGSFVQSKTYNIILEYADVGNLEQYFQNTPPPVEPEDVISFWTSMKGIAKGLARIHGNNHVDPSEDMVRMFHGYHHDLKPSNILVFSYGASSPYRYTFKIADLGLTHFVQVRFYLSSVHGHGEPGTRTYGEMPRSATLDNANKMSGSPETHRAREINPYDMDVPQKSDVWSLACIGSVATCWVVGGQRCIEMFSTFRRQARQDLGLEPSDCFHDNARVLPIVRQWHTNFLVQRARNTDYLTRPLWREFLEGAFSENVEARLWAAQVEHRMGELLRDVASFAHSQQVLSSESPPRTPIERKPRTLTMGSQYDSAQHEPSSSSLRDTREIDRSLRNPTLGHPGELSPPLTDPRTSGMTYPAGTRESLPGRTGTLLDNATGASPRPFHTRGGLNIALDLARPQDPVDTLTESFQQMSPQASQPHNNNWGNTTSSNIQSPTRITEDDWSIPQVNNTFVPSIGDPTRSDATAAPLPSANSKSEPKPRCPKHQPEEVGFMSVRDVVKWYHEKAWVPYEDLKDELKNRDHVFIIDNSMSMRTHWPKLVELFRPFAKFVKNCDEDGIELFFTQNRQDKMHKRHTSELISKVEALEGSLNAPSNPETVFRAVFDSDRRRRLREGKPKGGLFSRNKLVDTPLSVYFFTDGVWQPRAELWSLIGEVVDLLEQEPKKPPKHVGIQIIQFGKESRYTDKLKSYDDPAAYGLPKLARDIVDHEPCDENVWKMFLGSINTSFDDAECVCSSDGRPTS